MGLSSGTVLILITLLVVPIAAISFARSGGAWKQIGKGGLALEDPPPPEPTHGEGFDRATQEAEARQMLEAKAYRQERDGLPPLDVEAELRALLDASEAATAPAIDDELREEVRRLVIASNERRRRRGEPELDVEAETERQLAEFA
jgi:hypothetical protein